MTAEEILHKHIDKESMDELSVNVWLDMLEAMEEYAEKVIEERIPTEDSNPYPENVFIPISDDELKRVVKYLQDDGYSPDALFGHWARQVWNSCIEYCRNKMKGGEK